MVEIEHRSHQCDEREDDNHATYHLINNKDAIGIKLAPDLIDEPGESEPPQQSSENDAQIAHTKANCANVAIKRNTMSGLLSVTRNAVMPLCRSVPCLLLDLCIFFIGLLLKQ